MDTVFENLSCFDRTYAFFQQGSALALSENNSVRNSERGFRDTIIRKHGIVLRRLPDMKPSKFYLSGM